MGIYTKSSGEKVYTFSSKPRIPGDGVPDVLVKFQVVSRTQPCVSHHYFKLNSHTKLSKVRRHINPLFKNYFSNGFVFLSKTKEILRPDEAALTVFDILPKLPGGAVDASFQYPDVQYKAVSHDVEGERHLVVCACVVFMYEASKVSHWDPDILRHDLSANTVEGFCYIPTDILSWKQIMVECRASSLHQQAAIGSTDEVKTSLQQLPTNIHLCALRDQRDANPLHYAAENGHLEICELLVTGLGREIINHRDMNFRTPLHCALYRRRTSIIIYLLQLSADLTSWDVHGNTCLYLLVKQKSKDLELIVSKLQYDCIEPILQYLLVHLHLKKECSKIVRQMSKQLHQITEENTWQYLLLHYAAEIGDKELTENFIAKGCDVRAVDVQGLYPFHLACKSGNPHVDLFFFEELTDDDICLGLRFAVQKKHYSLCPTIKQLRSNLYLDEETMCTITESLDKELEKVRYAKQTSRALKNWEDIAKHLLPLVAFDEDLLNTFVFDSAFYGAVETLILLKSLGANFRAIDHMGRSPLHEACQRNCIKAVDILLRGGANPNTTDWRKSTPLHYACARGNDKIVSKLAKDERVRLDAQDICGRTPLLVSAYNKRLDVMYILLKDFSFRINLYASDVYGHNILHYTVHMNKTCLDLLFEKMQNLEKRTPDKIKTSSSTWCDETRSLCWYRHMLETNFSSCDEWKKIKRSAETRSESLRKKLEPFSNRKERTLWNQRPVIASKQPLKFKRVLYRCTRCQTFLAATSETPYVYSSNHECPKNSNEPETKKRKSYRMRPFTFHRRDFSDGSTPLLQALRMGQYQMMKRIDRLDPEIKNAKDGQNRNLLLFAIDQGNKTMVKASFELLQNTESDALSRIISQISKGTNCQSKTKLIEYLLSIGYSADDNFSLAGAGCNFRKQNLLFDCSVVDFAAAACHENIFQLLLEKTTKCNEKYCLAIAVSEGKLGIIDSLLRKRTKQGKAMFLRQQIGPILDIACCSKYLSLRMIESLVKICPDIIYNTSTVGTTVRLEGCEKQWNILEEGTTLGNLMSKDHPLRGTSNGKTKIEKVAEYLINAGINLENSDDMKDGHPGRHKACEAYNSAVECGYYHTAALILEARGHSIWKCSSVDGKCRIFSKQADQNLQVLQKHIRLACNNKVPDVWLKSLLKTAHADLVTNQTFRKQYIEQNKDLDYEEMDQVIQEIDEKVDDPFCRELLFMIRTIFGGDIADILQLIRVVPILYPFRHFLCCTFDEGSVKLTPDSLILKRCFRLPLPYQFYGKNSPTLLHVLSAYDNMGLMKDIMTAMYPVNINAETADGLRAVDVAAVFGSWNAYKTLMSNGADVTGQTLMACCSAGTIKRFTYIDWALDDYKMFETGLEEGFTSYTKRSYLLKCRDPPKDEGVRLKIIKDLCNRNVDLMSDCKSQKAVTCAIYNKMWDVLQYFRAAFPKILLQWLEKESESGQYETRKHQRKESHSSDSDSSDSSTTSYSPKHCTAAMTLFQYGPDELLQTILELFSANKITIDHKILQQMLLGASRKDKDVILIELINITCHNTSTKDWRILLSVFDENNLTTVHNAVIHGFYHVIVKLSHKIGSYEPLEKLWTEELGVTRSDSPLWYALTFKYWDIAKCLLIFDSCPLFRRAVPDLYTKGRFVTSVTRKQRSGSVDNLRKHKDRLRYYWQFRKTFPHLTNTSHWTASAIAPDIPCFGIRSKDYLCLRVRVKNIFHAERQTITSNEREKRREIKAILNLSSMAQRHGSFLIHAACATGNVPLVQELVHNRPEVATLTDKDGFLPIIYAVSGGRKEIVDSMKCDLDSKNAFQLMKVFLWKIKMLDSNQGKRSPFTMRNQFAVIHDNLRPLLPKELIFPDIDYTIENLEEKKEKRELEAVNEHVLALLQALKLSRDTICTENIFQHWCTIGRIVFENSGTDLTEETMKPYIRETMRNIDIRQLNPVIWISLMACTKPWMLDFILDIWSDDGRFLSKVNGRFFGEYSLIDLIVICAEPNHNRCKSYSALPSDYSRLVTRILSISDVPVKEETIMIAVRKNLWHVLEELVKKKVQGLVDITPIWYRVMIASTKQKESFSFFRTITEKADLYNQKDESKRIFHAFQCLASLYGRDDVLKYLFKFNIPLGNSMECRSILKLCENNYKENWNILHYTVKGGSVQILELVLRFLKHEISCIRSTGLTELLSLAFTLRVAEVQEKLTAFLETHLKAEMSGVNWDDIFLNVVKSGNEESALRLIEKKSIHTSLCDINNRNVLHYAAIHGLSKLSLSLLQNDPSKTLDVLDKHGKYPFDYVMAFGKTELLHLFSYEGRKITSLDNLVLHGCLRAIIQSNSKLGSDDVKSEVELFSFTKCAVSSDLFLKTLIRRSEDKSASFIVRHYRQIILQSKSYITCYHLAAKFSCPQTVAALTEIFSDDVLESIFTTEIENTSPLAWAIRTKNTECLEVITRADQSRRSCNWRAKNTHESLLHIAVKTGNKEIVTMIDEWSNGQLRDTQDKSGITPAVLCVALGEHDLLPLVTKTVIHSKDHESHTDGNTTFTCIECLLDFGIGWIKHFNQTVSVGKSECLEENSREIPSTYSSSRGDVSVRRFQYKGLGFLTKDKVQSLTKQERECDYFVWRGKYAWSHCAKLQLKMHKVQSSMEWFDFKENHPMAASLMISMGYRPGESSVRSFIQILQEKTIESCPKIKMQRSKLYAVRENGAVAKFSVKTAYELYETAASSGDMDFFKQNDAHFERVIQDLNQGRIIGQDGQSLAEIAYGFGHGVLGLYLKNYLLKNGSKDIYSDFKKMVPSLPQQLRWALRLELPGDDNWNITQEFENEVRLPKSDAFLVSSLSAQTMDDIGKSVDYKTILPSVCQGKKLEQDIESFKHHSCFSTRSNMWISCFMASSLIYGRIFEMLKCSDSKISSATSVHIRCLPEGSGEHPKTSIETNGVIYESVGISKIGKSSSLEYDKLPQQRSDDTKFKESILQEVIPELQLKMLEVFGHGIKLKIDLRSVESQRRTSGSVGIFRMLREGNRLAGLEDVIGHCEEMKQDIISMFNEKAAELALMPLSTVHEVTIKYVDTLPSVENTPQAKYTTLIPNCTWHFSIDRSTLKYDRTSFPLWRYIHLYHGSCVSLSYPLKQICNKTSETFSEQSQRHKLERNSNLTLEIDYKSFGAHSITSIHKLFSRKIEHEISYIAHLSDAMLRLSLSAEHILLQNTSSSKYTGLSLKENKITINMYATQFKSNEWLVSSENAQTTLKELEDKYLSLSIKKELLDDINENVAQVQRTIAKHTGLSLKISFDEKRFMSVIFERYRREMSDPFELMKKATRIMGYRLPVLYMDLFSLVLHSPSSTFCRLYPSMSANQGRRRVTSFNSLHEIIDRIMRNERDMKFEKLSLRSSLSPSLLFRLVTLFLPEYSSYEDHYPNELWTKTVNESFHQLTHNAIALVKDNPVSPWSKGFHDPQRPVYTLMRGSDLQNFATEDMLGIWVTRQTKNPLEELKSYNLIKYEDDVYQIVDGQAMQEVLKRVRRHENLQDVAVEALENGFETRLRDRMLPDFQNTISSISLPRHVLYQDYVVQEKIVLEHRLPGNFTQGVSVDWRSFCPVNDDTYQSEKMLKMSVENFMDTLYLLCRKFRITEDRQILCDSQKECRDILENTLSKLQFRLEGMNMNKHKTDKSEKRDSDSLEVFFKPTSQVIVKFNSQQNVELLPDYFHLVIIRSLEKETVSTIRNFMQETRQIDTRKEPKTDELEEKIVFRKGQLGLSLVLQLHRNMTAAIKSLFEIDSVEDTSCLSNLHNVQYLRSKATAINFVNGCLKVLISPLDLGQETLLRCLISGLSQSTDAISVTDQILFQLDGPEIYFSCSDVNTVRLKATDGNGNNLSDLKKEIVSIKESFRVMVCKADLQEPDMAGESTVFAESVDISDNTLTMTWSGSGLEFEGKANIKIMYHGRQLLLPNTTVICKSFLPARILDITKKQKVMVEKDGFVTIFLEHSLDSYSRVPDYAQNLHGNIPTKKNFVFHYKDFSNTVRFEIFVRRKKYYTSKLNDVLKLSKVPLKGNWNNVYKITCINHNRSVRIRAICMSCRKYLRIITPHRIFEPGEEIMIN